MKRELGIARCGLACCICSENEICKGCRRDGFKELSWCKDAEWCVNRKCVLERNLRGCYECDPENCDKGLYKDKIKPKAFAIYAKRYGLEELLDCLERNEKKGIVYHRSGIIGDYDGFTTVDELIDFIKTGERHDIIYNTATIKDIDELTKLRIDFIVADNGSISDEEKENVIKYFPDILKRRLGKELIAFTARAKGEIVSTAFLLIVEKLPNPKNKNGLCGEILSVYTKKEFRGRGIASELLSKLIEYAKNNNLSRIDLKATHEGYNLYKNLGFKDSTQEYKDMRLYL